MNRLRSQTPTRGSQCFSGEARYQPSPLGVARSGMTAILTLSALLISGACTRDGASLHTSEAMDLEEIQHPGAHDDQPRSVEALAVASPAPSALQLSSDPPRSDYVGWKGRTFADERIGFALTVPAGWRILSQAEIVEFYGRDKWTESASEGLTIEGNTALDIRRYAEHGNSSLRITTYTMVGDWPAMSADLRIEQLKRAITAGLQSQDWTFSGELDVDVGGRSISSLIFFEDFLVGSAYLRYYQESSFIEVNGVYLQLDVMWNRPEERTEAAVARASLQITSGAELTK